MTQPQAIQTEYEGYLFRSRLEARWAVFFDTLGIEWEYEPEGFVLEDGNYYLPDFYLTEFYCYFEVKRKSVKNTSKGYLAKTKISYGQRCGEWAGIICFGDPMDDDLYIYCQETDDGGGGAYENEVTIGLHPETGQPYLLSYEDRRERSFYPYFSRDMPVIPMVTMEYGKYSYFSFVNSRVINARKIARQARFEYGETPQIRRHS